MIAGCNVVDVIEARMNCDAHIPCWKCPWDKTWCFFSPNVLSNMILYAWEIETMIYSEGEV